MKKILYIQNRATASKLGRVVIDGKKLRGTSPRVNGTKGDYLMNAYVSENHLTIAQLQLKGKQNEIVAIPQLIEKLDIEGAVVSIDAIGTQVNIAQDILNLACSEGS